VASFSRRRYIGAVVAVLGAVSLFAGCGGSDQSQPPLQAKTLRAALQGLPFEYRLTQVRAPKGDEAAFEVVASKGDLKVHFTAAVGNQPLPVESPGAGTSSEIGISSLGLVFNDDTSGLHRFKNIDEYHQAVNMAVEIEEGICRKLSGKPCPV
jgi:hypothetical protein